MEASISIIIISLFIGLVAVKKWNIAYYIRKRLNKERDAPMKPFDCLPCFTAWTALILSGILFKCQLFNPADIIQFVVPTAATFIAAYLIDK